MKKAITAYLNLFFGKDLELRVRLFHVLAITGFIICVAMTFVSVAGQMWASMAINIGAGTVSLALLLYSARSKKYQFCYYTTILVIFFVLFPSLFFSGGGYKGGMPFFFVFAVVFTVYMLDGLPMLAFTVLEMFFYSGLCVLAYQRPDLIIPFDSEAAVVVDVIIGLATVSISLGATMYVQVRMYRRQQAEREKAQQEAEAANRSKSAFLASMSHEIRTPIHMILGLNEIIHRESRSSQVRGYSEKIDDTSKMLLSLVDSVLDMSKIESGKMELIPDAYDSANLVRTLLLIGRTNCQEKGLQFCTEISQQLPPRLFGDLTHIRQIASNLLSNAVKYTRSGSVTLRISPEDSGDPQRITLCIQVEDTGIGIPPEAIPTLFEAFARADVASHRHIRGTGLGLKIVQELTGLMDGTVSVSSTPGVGSIFTVRIPQTIPPAAPEEQAQCGGSFRAPEARILVVDDNETNRAVMRELLSPTGMAVDTAASGMECLQMVQETPYHMIFMDYMMPEMDGLEAMRRLKQLPDFHVPVIALTADATAETQKKLAEGGFVSCLTKPAPWARLRDTLVEFLPASLVTLVEEESPVSMPEIAELSRKLHPFGVFPEEALPYFENTLSRYTSTAALVLRRNEEELKKVHACRETENWNQLRFLVHAMKGKSKNLGMVPLAEICQYEEKLCQEGKYELLQSLLPYLLYCWNQGIKGLEELVPPAPGEAPGQGDPEQQISGYLREFRRKPALDCLRRMMAREASGEGQQLLSAVGELVDAFSFDQAQAALETYQNWKKEESKP